MQNTAKAIVEETGLDIQAADDIATVLLADLAESERLAAILSIEGDLSPYLTNEQLTGIAGQCLEDYRNDCAAREDWQKKAETALKRAKQEPEPEKTWPWKGASNASFPLLTTASLQFAARAYPAIVKGDEVVSCKVVGSDKGLPLLDEAGRPVMQLGGMRVVMSPLGPAVLTPDGPQPLPDGAQPEPAWVRAPGAKAARAQRVREFMNYTVFYRMKGWEEDTDTLLHHLPIMGCGFRKVYGAGGEQRSEYVSALKLVAPMDAKSCEESPRLTEIQDGQRLNDIIGQQRAGFYRDVPLVEDEKRDGLRTLLEQHCLIDLDEDGYAEPYVVKLDEDSGELLRLERNFGPQDVVVGIDGEVHSIARECYYVKYDFFPNLDGGFYGLGLGHLLDNIGKIVNNAINQMIDAGTAAAAGGGFIGSGVDLTGAGKRSSSISMAPGYYKTVNVPGSKLREAIYERTYPGPDPVTFQVLDLMLGAARDISSIKDVLTGEAKNTGQVGTTIALIEQGLQMFTAIYKRIYRSLKAEFEKLFRNIGRFGGEHAQADYMNVLDEQAATFEEDFNAQDFDIRPVSDPASVTKLQKMARAQFLGQFLGAPGVNPQAIMKRQFEAADVEDIDELWASPAQPDPMQLKAIEADIADKFAGADQKSAAAEKYRADAVASIMRERRADDQAQLQAMAEGFRLVAS